MFEAVAAATAVITLLTPALAVGEPAGELLPWLRAHLTGRAAEALADLEAHPDSEALQLHLREEIATQLRQDPALLAGLAAVLPPESAMLATESPPLEGGGAIGALTHGNSDTMR